MANKNDKKSKKQKRNKIILWTLIVVLTLGIAAYIVLYLLITDENKNQYKDESLSNQEIINKEFVNGLAQMNESFNFTLSENEINQMLLNSLKSESVSRYVNSAYLDIKDTNFKWCFDLNVPLFTTRLIINTHIDFVENSYMFAIDSMTIGKLQAWSYLENGGYISNEVFDCLFSHASLPIESHLENGCFVYYPTMFISMFNLKEVTNEFFATINVPSRLTIENNCVGFKLSLEGVRQDSFLPLEGDYDLPNQLESLVETNTLYNSLIVNKQTPILEVSEEDFSKWVKDCYSNDKEIERIESDLVNSKVNANLKKVEIKFTNNEFVVQWTLKLGNIYIRVSESLGNGVVDNKFKIKFARPTNETALQTILMDDFIDKFISKGYSSYEESDKFLYLDFTSVNMSSSVKNFTTKKLDIVNNKLTFFLTRTI